MRYMVQPAVSRIVPACAVATTPSNNRATKHIATRLSIVDHVWNTAWELSFDSTGFRVGTSRPFPNGWRIALRSIRPAGHIRSFPRPRPSTAAQRATGFTVERLGSGRVVLQMTGRRFVFVPMFAFAHTMSGRPEKERESRVARGALSCVGDIGRRAFTGRVVRQYPDAYWAASN